MPSAGRRSPSRRGPPRTRNVHRASPRPRTGFPPCRASPSAPSRVPPTQPRLSSTQATPAPGRAVPALRRRWRLGRPTSSLTSLPGPTCSQRKSPRQPPEAPPRQARPPRAMAPPRLPRRDGMSGSPSRSAPGVAARNRQGPETSSGTASVADAGWSQLLRCIDEKAAHYGRTFHRAGRFEPTSQVCSACGVKDGPKPLSVRQWTCTACGAAYDRDVNAARNILAAGRADKSNACGAGVRPQPVAVGAEAGTHPSAA